MGVNLAESGVDGVQLNGRGLEHKKRPVLPSVLAGIASCLEEVARGANRR